MKKKTKKLLTVILSIALAIGIITAGVFLLKPKDTKRIYPTYHIGSINESGDFVESDDAIYSDLFECQGLKIEPNFNSKVSYSVYFYRFDESFVDSELNLTTTYEAPENDIVKYARIVIIPDRGDKSEEDYKIWFWNILGISDDIKVSVNTNQKDLTNLVEIEAPGKWGSSTATDWNQLKAIDVSNMNKVAFVCESGVDSVFNNIVYRTSDSGSDISLTDDNKLTSKIIVLDVSEVSNIYISIKSDVKVKIYKYE